MPDDSPKDRDERMREAMERLFQVGAERFLEDLEAQIAASVAQQRGGEPSFWVGMAEGAVGALVAVGEVPHERRHEVVRRLLKPLTDSGVITPVTSQATAVATARAESSSPQTERPTLGADAQNALELQCAVSIAQTVRLADERTLVVTSVEVWGSDVILRWREGGRPDTRRGSGHRDWKMTDDDGVEYYPTGGGAQGGDTSLDCHVAFRRPIDASVSRLTFTIEDETISVALPRQ